MRLTKRTMSLMAAGLAALLVHAAAAPAPAVNLDGSTASTDRLSVELAPSALPKQVRIKATKGELPLEHRDDPSKVETAALQQLGRGPQLRSPIRLVATSEGSAKAAKVQQPGKPSGKDGAVAASSKLKAGPLNVQINSRFDGHALQVDLSYGGGKVEGLELVVPLAAPVDQVVAGNPVAGKVQSYDPKLFGLDPPNKGLVWANAKGQASNGGPTAPGLVKRLFVGNGDRGFTFTTDGGDGWSIDKAEPMSMVERDEAGRYNWRIRVVNTPTEVSGTKKVSFTLRFHPSRTRPAGHRKQQWLSWPGDAPRADQADAGASHVELAGPAAGRPLSAEKDHSVTYPLAMVRYLAGTHTGRVARIVPQTAQQTVPGADRTPDRVVMGRALAMDAGVDLSTLAQVGQAGRMLKAIHEFGYFKNDGKTEFIPYWRSNAVARYGEQVTEGSAFNTAEQRDRGGVYLSVYRRPFSKGNKSGYQAMFVILNERDEPTRRRLYIHDPQATLGSSAELSEADIVKNRYDFSHLPEKSDHRIGNYLGGNMYGANQPALRDLENDTVVKESDSKGQDAQIFGPIYVEAHDYRIVWTYGLK